MNTRLLSSNNVIDPFAVHTYRKSSIYTRRIYLCLCLAAISSYRELRSARSRGRPPARSPFAHSFRRASGPTTVLSDATSSAFSSLGSRPAARLFCRQPDPPPPPPPVPPGAGAPLISAAEEEGPPRTTPFREAVARVLEAFAEALAVAFA
jgi:hypothetical protein